MIFFFLVSKIGRIRHVPPFTVYKYINFVLSLSYAHSESNVALPVNLLIFDVVVVCFVFSIFLSPFGLKRVRDDLFLYFHAVHINKKPYDYSLCVLCQCNSE